MSFTGHVARNALWSMASSWLRLIATTLSFVVLAALLGPRAYGLMAMAMIFISFAHVFVGSALPEALIQRRDIKPAHADSLFWFLVLVSVAISGLYAIAAALIARLFDLPELADIVRAMTCVVIFIGIQAVPAALLRREIQFAKLAIAGTVGAIAGGLSGVGLALAGGGVWSLVTLQITAAAVECLAILWLTKFRPGRNVSFVALRDILNVGPTVIGVHLMGYLDRHLPSLLIGLFLGPVSAGIYVFAKRITNLVLRLLVHPINTLALPLFSRFQEDPERTRRLFGKYAQTLACVALPVYVGLIVVADPLVRAVFGSRWLDAIIVLQILAFAGVKTALSSFHGPIMRAFGRTGTSFCISASTTLAAGAIMALMAGFGDFGVAALMWVIVLRSYMVLAMTTPLVRHLVDIPIVSQLKPVAAPVGATVLMAGGVALLLLFSSGEPPWVQLLVAVPPGIVIFFVALWWLAPDIIQNTYRLIISSRESPGQGSLAERPTNNWA